MKATVFWIWATLQWVFGCLLALAAGVMLYSLSSLSQQPVLEFEYVSEFNRGF